MIVAAVAYDNLTPATKTRVARLLAKNQYPVNGTNDAGSSARAKARFMQAATAPDAIKAQPKNCINDGEDAAKVPAPSENIGFSDRFMHKYWHYIDIPFSPDGTPLQQPQSPNVQERITLFRQTLASTAPDTLKAFDLVWLLHLVGDIHQPLHATSRFTHTLPNGDNGGNDVKLTGASAKELHAYWDDLDGTSKSVKAAMTVARQLPKPEPELLAKTDASDWAQESFTIAQSAAYAPPIGPYQLDATYKAQAAAGAQQRLALAGLRLAKLLNTELK